MNTTFFEFLMGYMPRGIRKRYHYWKKRRIIEMKMLDFEFLRLETQDVREGFRMDYDRMKESRDAIDHYRALINKVGMEKASEIGKLGPEKTQEILAGTDMKHNLEQKDRDVIKNLEEKWQQYNTDMAQLEKQMTDIDGQIDGINEKVKGFRYVIELMENHKL